MNDISFIFAFTAGLVSFLSPCVLPIIPGFLAYLAGSSTDKEPSRWAPFYSSLFFVLGFSVIFALLGILLNTVLENIAYEFQTWLSRIGGALIIIFGLYLTKLIRIPFLERDHKIAVKRKFRSKHLTSLVFGAAFAAGWTPCVGAVLGAILGLAASNPGSSFLLLLTYSIGLGIPFLLVGLFTTRAKKVIERHASKLETISIIFGYLLIILGVLVFTESLSLIANFGFVNDLILK